MSKKTPTGIHSRGPASDSGSADGRRRLRSHQCTTTATPLRRSPRFHQDQPQKEEDDAGIKMEDKSKKSSSRDRRQQPSRPMPELRTRRRSPRLASRRAEIVESASAEVVAMVPTVEHGEKKEIFEEGGRNKKKRRKEIGPEEEGKEIGGRGYERCCGRQEGWTEEQEQALRRAYLLAKPSPHFWKKISKMVAGKSAHECFNRIHADLATPPQSRPRSRAKKTKFSPISNFSFSDNSVDLTKQKTTRARSRKQRSLVAHKTVRHLLRKHFMVDQAEEADHFRVLETSPNSLRLELPEIESPDPPCFLLKCNEKSSSTHKTLLSRIKTNQADNPSPEVLKRIKNIALHEKYIDHLHTREARRRVGPKITSSDIAIYSRTTLRDARDALITEAREAISHFQHAQPNLEGQNSDSDCQSANSDGSDDI